MAGPSLTGGRLPAVSHLGSGSGGAPVGREAEEPLPVGVAAAWLTPPVSLWGSRSSVARPKPPPIFKEKLGTQILDNIF